MSASGGKGDDLEAYARIVLCAVTPPRIDWLGFRFIPPGGVIEAVLAALQKNYVFPETAEKMAAAIDENQQKGSYDTVTDGGVLADQLGRDLRDVSHDQHLRVEWSPFTPPAQRPLHRLLDQLRKGDVLVV